ncbi:AlbA family DNA-binding domain-containing protein [Marinobacterium weihaiense]|uniref:AlbA family DNA-binding domain-containing protein n=1 Tax=Marinobacterium weihaiense TaxID=2851016 RepID=UPI0020B848F8|nr:ATP-binding protein [Marinobacterium weihaiense]
MQREYRRLSRRTQYLLSLPEGLNVDFKREVHAVKSSDLVAFANTAQGGTLLIGIDEYTADNGVQRGRVVGCEVDDKARLMLVNKSTGCIPNVEIQIFTENLSQARPILRVEIAPGQHKPYCTQRGEYAVRTDGRNRALLPEELLAIFMEREGEQFLSRFRDAVHQLEHQLGSVSHALSEGMLGVSERLYELDHQLQRTLGRIEQLTDSNKKRSRNLMQALRQSQAGIVQLENSIAPVINDQGQHLLQDIEHKLGMLLDLLDSDSGNGHQGH